MKRTKRKSPPCPECGNRTTATIQYGYPAVGTDTDEALDTDECEMGGCIITDDSPEYRCKRCGYRWRADSPPVTTFPIYILELDDKLQVVAPADRRDIGHSLFWEHEVARMVARHYHLNPSLLDNLPYSQRRARIASDKIYYGEAADPKVLMAIRKALAKPRLGFVYDDHEKRLPFDVREFEALKG